MIEESLRRTHTCSFILWLRRDCLTSLLSPLARTSHIESPKCRGAGKYRGAHGIFGERCCPCFVWLCSIEVVWMHQMRNGNGYFLFEEGNDGA